MQHLFDVCVLLLLASAVCNAYWRPRDTEPVILTEPVGTLTFNSSLELAPLTYREWILAPFADRKEADENGRPPLFRIFVEEIRLDAGGDQCPNNKRITIGNADQPDGQDSVAYCKHLRNFEISVLAHRVYIRIQCPPGTGPVYIRLHFGMVVPSTQQTGLQRPGRQICLDPFHDTISDSLHSHLWACRPVFYGQLSETQCLATSQICNGVEDCPSGEDESLATCTKQTATVIETMHSLGTWLNSTQAAWPAGTDPNASSASTLLNIALHPCHPGEFQCKVRNRENGQTNFVCISNAWVCDGHVDCPGGEDEAPELCSNQKAPVGGCPPDTFSCPYDAKCLDYRFICDGKQDCFKSVDESTAACRWKREHRPATSVTYQQNSNYTDSRDVVIDKLGIHANLTMSVFIEWGLTNRLCPPQKPYLCRYSQTCLTLSALCNGKVECPDQMDESVIICALFESIKSAMDKSTELLAPSAPDTCHGATYTHPWVTGVYSHQCFLCYGVLISGANSSWWVIVPASCGKHLSPGNLTVIPGNSSESYRVDSRQDQPNLANVSSSIPQGFSLLKIGLSFSNITSLQGTNHTNNVTSTLSSLEGFNFTRTTNETAESTCELITPVRCQRPLDGERFAPQRVQPTSLSVCQQSYPHFTGFNISGLICVPQEICLQRNLGAVLVCNGTGNSTKNRLGFAVHGGNCATGQLTWPVIVSTTTEETVTWIEVAVGNRPPPPPPSPPAAICGYAPDGKFPWFVYFNMRSGVSYCLGVYVENDTFPLITSERCLVMCLRANGLQKACNLEAARLPAIGWLRHPKAAPQTRLSLPVKPADMNMNICPAKAVHERLANATAARPVWTQCTLAYLYNSTSKAFGIEMIKVLPFTACQGEDFYWPLRDKMLLCVLSMGEQPLNCQHWTDAALVQCQRASTLQWELVGLAPACRSSSAYKWFLRVLPW
ncbi:Protein fam98a [Sparganum proliferum]